MSFKFFKNRKIEKEAANVLKTIIIVVRHALAVNFLPPFPVDV